MQFKEAKIERSMTRDELAAFLRELADTLEDSENPNSLANFHKLSMSLKMTGQQAYARLKLRNPSDGCCKAAPVPAPLAQPEIKPAHEPASEQQETPVPEAAPTIEPVADNEPLPSYKSLKKNMKDNFKIIFKAVHEGTLPPADVVESFVKDAHTMTRFPGKGDEYYAEFREAANELVEALQSGNLAQLNETADRLNHMKTECHARHK